MNRVVRRGAPPVLLTLVATRLVAAPAGAAPTWIAPAVTLAEGTNTRPPADSHVVVDAAGNATVAWPKPTLSQVKLAKKTIHVAGSDEEPRATKLKLTIDLDAPVVLRLKRTAQMNGNAVKAKLTQARKSGQRAIKLTSEVGGKHLARGAYRITVRAMNSVGASAVRTVKLMVVP